MLPMQRHRRHTIFVQEQKPGVTIDHRLALRLWTALQDPFAALINIICHGQCPGSCARLGALHIIAHISPTLQLVINDVATEDDARDLMHLIETHSVDRG